MSQSFAGTTRQGYSGPGHLSVETRKGTERRLPRRLPIRVVNPGSIPTGSLSRQTTRHTLLAARQDLP